MLRKKLESRGRLLDAAFRLMAERGLDGVAIQEITEAADVATGGFYNHFKSKQDIYFALTRRVFEDFGDALDVLVAKLEDPAEVVAVCIRQTVLRAKREPVWGQFLLREGLSPDAARRGLGSRLRRDIQRGIERGRFKPLDPVMAFVATGGAVLAAILYAFVNTFVTTIYDGTLANIVGLLLMLIVLIVKPTGLFGAKERA